MASPARGPRRCARRVAFLSVTAVCLSSAAIGFPAVASATEPGVTSVSCTPSATAGWRVPVRQQYVITSTFGERIDPINHRRTMHAGVDLAIRSGPGPVVAASAGTVVRAGPYGGLGNEVTLRHPGGVETLYGHMSSIDSSIRPGAHVAEGQQLGVEGSTGHSTGPHVHFEIHVDGKAVDPIPFMTSHSAPLTGTPSAAGSTKVALPPAASPRRSSLKQPALPVPADIMKLYKAAAQKYAVPWQLLAGVGMEETAQGRNNHTSSAGAKGFMQFMPQTFAHYGVDGNGDGKVDIHDDADSIFSAANALRDLGVDAGEPGVRKALFAYNHAKWYVNDVLYYAAAYAGDAGGACTTGAGATTTSGPASSAVGWARTQVGRGFQFGADGPQKWDSSSFVQAAYKQGGIDIPRTAQAQRDWLAAGHGVRVQPGDERPGDLIFADSYLGPDKIGFVMLVTDPSKDQAIAARNPDLGVTYADYTGMAQSKHIFQIWRVKPSS